MKWMRYTAFAIGMVFGSVFLLFNLDGLMYRIPGFWDTLPLLTGPVTLFIASLVGLKFARAAGWWLVIGAGATAFVFTARQAHSLNDAPRLAAIIAVLCLPMVFSGVLWLAHADYHPPGADLPWMD